MNCPKCGNILVNGTTSCPKCGTFIQSSDQNMYQQIPRQQQNTYNINQQYNQKPNQNLKQSSQVNTTSYEEPPKKKKGILKALVLLVIFAGIGAGALFLLTPKIKNSLYKPKQASYENFLKSNSLLLPDENMNFAVFTVEGKQLSDYKYKAKTLTFVNDTAVVQNENGEYGIITSQGNALVPFGKYTEINAHTSIYIAKDSSGKNYVYSRAGKLIKELGATAEVFKEDRDYLYTGVFDGENYLIFSYKGDEVLNIPLVQTEQTMYESGKKKSPYIKADYYSDEYIAVFYNNHNYIVNIETNELITDFESNYVFTIAAVNEKNKNEVFITSESSVIGWTNSSEEKIEYKLIRDKKVVYAKEHNHQIESASFNNNVLEFEDISNHYLVTETGDKIVIDVEDNYIFSYVDFNNYLKRSPDRKVELYESGTKKMEFNCIYADSSRESNNFAFSNVYVLKSCTGYDKNDLSAERDLLVKTDGTIIGDKAYHYISIPDSHGNFIVVDDDETCYLIDPTGKKISKNYSLRKSYYEDYEPNIEILRYDAKDLYIGQNKDGTRMLFNADGTEYVTADYISIIRQSLLDDILVEVKSDGYYSIYNVTKKKEIFKGEEEPDYSEFYFSFTKNNKIELYSYITGKLFYTADDKEDAY